MLLGITIYPLCTAGPAEHFQIKWGLEDKHVAYAMDIICPQRYTYRVLRTIQMKLILLWVWAERAVLGRAKTALKSKYEI